MKDFLSDIATLKWWVSVVLVGILINIISAYLGKGTNTLFSSISKKYRIRNTKIKEARDKNIQFLKDNPSEKYLISLEELKLRINALTFFLLSVLSIVANNEHPFIALKLAGLFAGFVSVVMGFISYIRANKKHDLYRDAYKENNDA